ncbi:MAG: hypothetical protein KDA84_22790 [Planctomycetaceae bacterium]|nr:hypothetical protein [Planctomycetaceae bacterium]
MRTYWFVLLLGVTTMAGCSAQVEDDFNTLEPGKDVKPAVLKHEHGPHGGHVSDLGDGKNYRADITFDGKTRDIVVHLLDADSKPLTEPTPEEVELHLEGAKEHAMEATELKDVKVWRLAGKQVPEAIDNIEKIRGHLHVTIAGQELEAEFTEEDEDHDHSEEHHDS